MRTWRLCTFGGRFVCACLTGLYALTHWVSGLGPSWYDGLWQGWFVVPGALLGVRFARRRRPGAS
jgi:hypothetical protein